MDPVTAVAAGSAVLGAAGSYFGGQDQARAQKKLAKDNIALQKEFAKNGIRWKVADAKAAGLHPLAALGAQTHSFSPIAAGDTTGPNALSALGDMGQNISRAMAARQTSAERELQTLQLSSAKLDVEGKAIENQIRLKSLSNMSSRSQVPPPTPSGNTPHSGLGGVTSDVRVKPSETTATMPGLPSQEAAIIPMHGWARTESGGLAPVASKDIKERIEDSFIPETLHAIRNNILPNFGAGPKPPNSLLPRGYDHWKWNHASQEFFPARKPVPSKGHSAKGNYFFNSSGGY